MKTKFILFASILSLVISILSKDIPFVIQWPLFEALRTTSGIIFTVLGIWLAIMYPERLKMTESQSYSDVNKNQEFNELFNPIVISIITLATILLIGIIAPILKSYLYILEYKIYLRKFSFFILLFLTIVQIWVVFATLLPASNIKLFSDENIQKHKVKDARNKKRN